MPSRWEDHPCQKCEREQSASRIVWCPHRRALRYHLGRRNVITVVGVRDPGSAVRIAVAAGAAMTKNEVVSPASRSNGSRHRGAAIDVAIAELRKDL
jgi:hypothetical protein